MRWGDMDAYQHVNNVAYLGYLEEARIDLIFRLGAERGLAALREGLIVARHEIDYLAPLVWHPRGIDVEVWVERIGGSSFVVAYRVHDDSTTYATAQSTLVAYDLAAQRQRRLSPAERGFFQAFTDGEQGEQRE